MIIDYKCYGLNTKKNEVIGEFSKGGFSSKINYIDHLRDLNEIRLSNNQNRFLFIFYIL